ncbi:class I SAM-dependent methyltransferase [Candidatus Ventrimonas sp. KK005]|nr:class I SAM-dependent methyltransferase [Clostridiaceae bacterium]
MEDKMKEKIGKHWSLETNQKNCNRDRWWKSPTIIRHINQTICGEPLDGWNAAGIKLAKRVLSKQKILELGLSVGSGNGMKELNLLENGLVRKFICFDFSEDRISQGRENAKNKGLSDRIIFLNEDFFESIYASKKYDMVFWDNSLHHMMDAFVAVQKSYEVLRKGGIFFCNDFVGKNQFQWSDMELAIVNGVRASLDNKIFQNPNGENFQRIVGKPTIEWMNNTDPSEAADSQSIIPAIEKVFSKPLIIPTGGLIYHLCLNDILVNIEEDSNLLKYLLKMDDETIKMGMTQYAFALGIK